MFFRIWEYKIFGHDHLEHFLVTILACIEWWETTNHLISQNSKSPPVSWEWMSFFSQELGTHILRCTAEWICLFLWFQRLCKAEISQLDISILTHEDIFWLQVSIDNFLAMQVSKSQCNWKRVKLGSTFIECSSFLKMSEQFTSSDKFHHKENVWLSLKYVFHTNHEWMISLFQDILL